MTLKPIRHGTIGGHRAHYRHGEPMCEPCRDANRVYRGNSPQQPVQCGTRSGYVAHTRRGETPCRPCREASNAYARERARRPLSPSDRRHGTVNGYRNLGCRCDTCRAAGSIDNARLNAGRRRRAS